MAAQRRSSKQRRRGSGTATAPAADATVAAQAVAAESSVKQADATAKSTAAKNASAKSTASKQASGVSEKPNRFKTRWEKITRAFHNTVSEIKKITWPDAETTRNLTILVIAMSTVLGLLLGGIDFLLLKLFESF